MVRLDPVPAMPIDLPSGWEAKVINSRMVFINHTTKRTQWENPVTGAKPGMAVTVPIEVTPPASSPESSPETVVSLYVDRACEKPEDSIEIEEVAGFRPPGRSEHQASSSGGIAASDNPIGERASLQRSDKSTKSVHFGNDIWAVSTELIDHSRDNGKLSLPQGWTAHRTEEGELYYANHACKITTWTRPTPGDPPLTSALLPQTAPASGGSPALDAHKNSAAGATGGDTATGRNGSVASGHIEQLAIEPGSDTSGVPPDNGQCPLPPGWSARTTKTGDVYYVNYSEKRTTWVRPVTHSNALSLPSPHAGVTTLAITNYQEGSATTDDVEPSLPPGWRACKTRTGEVYYLNHTDKTTTWTKPVTPRAAPSMPSSQEVVTTSLATCQQLSTALVTVEPPLPAGWGSCKTKTGEVYYINHYEKSTTWVRPVAVDAAPSTPPPQPRPPAQAFASRQQRSVDPVDGEPLLLTGGAGWDCRTTKAREGINHGNTKNPWARTVCAPSPILVKPRARQHHRAATSRSTSRYKNGDREQRPPPAAPAHSTAQPGEGHAPPSHKEHAPPSWLEPTPLFDAARSQKEGAADATTNSRIYPTHQPPSYSGRNAGPSQESRNASLAYQPRHPSPSHTPVNGGKQQHHSDNSGLPLPLPSPPPPPPPLLESTGSRSGKPPVHAMRSSSHPTRQVEGLGVHFGTILVTCTELLGIGTDGEKGGNKKKGILAQVTGQ